MTLPIPFMTLQPIRPIALAMGWLLLGMSPGANSDAPMQETNGLPAVAQVSHADASTPVAAVAVELIAFNVLDRDHDGQLTHDEAVADATLAVDYEAADSNRNGQLSREEFRAFGLAVSQQRQDRYLDDAAMDRQIRSSLANQLRPVSSRIGVAAYKGEITLSGYVDSEAQVQRAAAIAAATPGVVSVKNGLVSKG